MDSIFIIGGYNDKGYIDSNMTEIVIKSYEVEENELEKLNCKEKVEFAEESDIII